MGCRAYVANNCRSLPAWRTREHDLTPEAIVDEEDLLEERPPEDDAVRAPGVREVDADK